MSSSSKAAKLLGYLDDPAHPPPLAGLATAAALAALALRQATMGLSSWRGQIPHIFLVRLDDAAGFALNVAALAGLVALSAALVGFVRSRDDATLRRRLLVVAFAIIFVLIMMLATFLPKDKTSMQRVLFAIGAGNVLAVLITMTAAVRATSIAGRIVAIGGAATALFALCAHVVHLLSKRELMVWHAEAFELLRGVGEIAYLATLFCGAAWLIPRRRTLRDRVARYVGISLFVATSYLLYVAYANMGSDYALLLYHAQRVTWFIDRQPIYYAFPLCIGFSSAIAALLGSDRVRAQGALGLLLLLAGGYAPRAPGQLLAMTLAMVLIARAVLALSQRTAGRNAAPIPLEEHAEAEAEEVV